MYSRVIQVSREDTKTREVPLCCPFRETMYFSVLRHTNGLFPFHCIELAFWSGF